jgi:hypothetical protein
MRRKPRDEYARSDARTGSGVGEVAAPAITEGYSYQPYVLDTYSLPTDCRLKPAPLPEPIAAGDEWREQFWEAEAKVNRLIELCREQPALNSCLTVYQIYEAIGLANVHEISIKDHANPAGGGEAKGYDIVREVVAAAKEEVAGWPEWKKPSSSSSDLVERLREGIPQRHQESGYFVNDDAATKRLLKKAADTIQRLEAERQDVDAWKEEVQRLEAELITKESVLNHHVLGWSQAQTTITALQSEVENWKANYDVTVKNMADEFDALQSERDRLRELLTISENQVNRLKAVLLRCREQSFGDEGAIPDMVDEALKPAEEQTESRLLANPDDQEAGC